MSGDVLLHFPAELSRYREFRDEALVRFRARYRLPVIKRYGAATEDVGALVTHCDACGFIGAQLKGLGDVVWDLTPADIEAEISSRAEDPVYGWRPERCAECGAPEPTPIVALFGRYLPEAGVDLHLELAFGGGRILRARYHRMEPDGSTRPVPRPEDELSFADIFGAPFSVRGLWRDFIGRHLYADELTVHQVEPGYVIGLRPFADRPEEAARHFFGFSTWLHELRRMRPHDLQRRALQYDAVTFLRDREEDDIPVPFEESYHAWLAGYAHDIAEALIDPFIVADSDTFLHVLAAQAAAHGLRVTRKSDASTLFGRFSAPELEVDLNLAPVFFRVLHEGFSFERGLRRHFGRELAAMRAAAGLPAVLRRHLPGCAVEVRDGTELEVARPGAWRFRDDLVYVATSFDYETPAGLSELIEHVSAGAAAR